MGEPGAGAVPRHETQACDFVKAFPEYDGRGVVVAILDTGVDPGAAGLQQCPDGRPKLIDIVDCTGGGDVDMSTVIAKENVTLEDGIPVITGLSGRKLRLNPAWKNPSGEWRVGIKRAFELYNDRGLGDRMKKEHKKAWDVAHKAAEAAAQKNLADFRKSRGGTENGSSLSAEAKQELQDLEDLLDQLAQCEKDHDEPGLVLDCVVWSDGSDFWAAVDTSDKGDLTTYEAMTDFRKQRQFRPLSEKDCLNYGCNIFDDGAVLSILTDSGAHGTHVAGIVAAHHPGENGERDGVAPGAQLVSLVIGDVRLGGMETGPSLMRALAEAVRLKVDIINMSFGEATALPNTGRFIDLAKELVYKHNILFVSSAGNSGPATATVGCPGGACTAVLSVAAHVSPAMMRQAYSMYEQGACQGGPYTWTSVGPAQDGAWGVSLSAPGGAITSVPNWTLQASQLMNGTSMASPNCAGCAALLLSGLKARDLPRTPNRVRRAIENSSAAPTTLNPHEPLVVGHGMVQTLSAWERLVAFAGSAQEDLNFSVTVEPAGGYGGFAGGARRGLHLRQASEVEAPTSWNVRVEPQFHEDAPNAEKIALELHLRIECDAPWVAAPETLTLMHNGRSFGIRVDPTSLPEGLHFCLVRGFDSAAPHSPSDGLPSSSSQSVAPGLLFEVPITIVRPRAPPPPPVGAAAASPVPLPLPATFAPGQVVRTFLTLPFGCTWIDVAVRDTRASATVSAASVEGENNENGSEKAKETDVKAADSTRRMMVVHVLQLMPHTPFRDIEKAQYLQLHPGQTEVVSARVESSATVEVVCGQFWSASGMGGLEAQVSFRGVLPNPSAVTLHGGSRQAKVYISSHVGLEKVEPFATLKTWQAKVTPSTAVVSPLGPRDIMPGGAQMYQLILEYPFNQAEDGDVTPRLPALNNYLYESAFHAQMCMLFDNNKKLLGFGDAWPHAVKCPKGDCVLRVQVRHDSADTLKQLQGMSAFLERSVGNGAKGISVPCYASMMERWNNGKTFPVVWLPQGTQTCCFFAEPSFDKLPKGAKPGDCLHGSVTFVKAESTSPGEGKRPKGFPLTYVVGPAPPPQKDAAKADGAKGDTGEPPKTEEQKLLEAVRDLKVSKLAALATSGSEAFEALFDKAIAEFPDHLPLLQTQLHAKDAEKGRSGRLEEVVAAADAVIAAIDKDELAKHFGTNTDPTDPKQTALRKEMQRRRDVLADALARKARALADAESEKEKEKEPKETVDGAAVIDGAAVPAGGEGVGSTVDKVFLAAYKELQQWEDVTQEKYSRVQLAYLLKTGRKGSALKLLSKLIGGATSKVVPKAELLELRAKLFAELGWQHLVEYDQKWRVLGSPKAYPLF